MLPLHLPSPNAHAELNMAYSQHEIVGDYVRPTLMWLESQVSRR